MSLRKGIRYDPGKAKAASIFGKSPAAAAPKAKPVPWEHNLQVAVVKWNRHYALPLKAMVWSSLEGVVLDILGKKKRSDTQAARAAAINADLKAAGKLNGIPDTNWAIPPEGTTHGRAVRGMIELKAGGSSYSDLGEDQRERILNLLDAGQLVGIAQSRFDVQDLLRGWGVKLRQMLPEEERPIPHPQRQKWPLEGEELRAMILSTTPPNKLREWGYVPMPKQAKAPLAPTSGAS